MTLPTITSRCQLLLLACAALLALPPAAARAGNLIPNWNFADAREPLSAWRVDFPFQERYIKNAGYVSVSPNVRDGDARAVVMDLPKGVAENEGGKVETALVAIEPGASYHASVDVLTSDLAAKLFVEVYALDPTPPGAPSLDRLPAAGGLPALVKCYRAVFADPPAKSATWFAASRDFTVPAQVTIAAKPAAPAYAAIKAFGLSTWQGGSGKVYFSKFVLMKTKAAPVQTTHAALP